jgi:hypothetical protein
MSGPICPDCTTLALIETHGLYSCPICGWSGRDPPRKIMDTETNMELSERTRRFIALRWDNRLRYVRVDLSGDDNVRSDAVFEIMELLGVREIEGDNQLRFFVEGKMDDIEIEEISNITGVKKVSIF